MASTLQAINGKLLPSSHQHSTSSDSHSLAVSIKWRLKGEDRLNSRRRNSQAFRVLANPNVSPGKESKSREVIMVDPVEAKRLAKKQMEQIKARERLQRRRRIEAINGAWAMIGLTAGIIIEGHTGQSIPEQLLGYWNALIGIFTR